MTSLPYEIRNQIIQCFGTCFHYKDNMETFLVASGIERSLARRHRDLPKFVWAKNLLNDLDQVEDGYALQRRILTELCKLRSLPDKEAPNPDAALDALRSLKQMAIENDLVVASEKQKTDQKKTMAEEKARLVAERAARLQKLKDDFFANMLATNRQAAGYALEDILEKLFPLFLLEYRKSYRTPTHQIDGHFRFEGFDYLVEAKWRSDQPTEQEIGGFKQMVETKLDATRGMFISIVGFRDEVVSQFQGRGAKIIFVDGEDITHILEGRIELPEALRTKIEKAAQEGNVFFRIREML